MTMHPKHPLNDTIPWGDPQVWDAIIKAFQTHRPALIKLTPIACKLATLLNALFPLLDSLCRASCLYCPDPCCLKAKIWFDFQDLIFLNTRNGYIPPAQATSRQNRVCRYLGHRGCSLERLNRPWACTLYLCPTQTARLRQSPRFCREAFDTTIIHIKTTRKELEEAFIDLVS